MPNKAWKSFERRVAQVFFCRRNPLSGINSTITGSDTTSTIFYIECKQRAKSFIHSLFQETKVSAKKENKLPVLAVQQKGSPGFMVCIHSSDLEEFCSEYKLLLEEEEYLLSCKPKES